MNPILLINAHSPLHGQAFSCVRFPLVLGMLGAQAAAAGYHCELLDFAAHGYDAQGFGAHVAEAAPSMAVVLFETPAAPAAHAAAQAVKEHSPGTLTVACGPHAAALPAATLRQFPSFDAAFTGEPDETFAELCRAVDRGLAPTGIEGLAFRAGGQVVVQAPRPVPDDLDALPRAARALRPPRAYDGTFPVHFIQRGPRTCAVEVETLRGCPYTCSFCAANACAGSNTRFRSVSSVTAEIEELVESYGANTIVFTDPVFVLHRPRVEALCEQLRRMGVRWTCRAAPHLVNEALLAAMAEAGCRHILFTIPSGDDDLLVRVNAPFTVDQARAAAAAARAVGIPTVEARVLIGAHASETREQVRATWNLVRELAIDVLDARLAVPLPGSPLYLSMVKRALILENQWVRFLPWGAAPPWRTEHFAAADLARMQAAMMRAFYQDKSRGRARLRRLRSLSAWRLENRIMAQHLKSLPQG